MSNVKRLTAYKERLVPRIYARRNETWRIHKWNYNPIQGAQINLPAYFYDKHHCKPQSATAKSNKIQEYFPNGWFLAENAVSCDDWHHKEVKMRARDWAKTFGQLIMHFKGQFYPLEDSIENIPDG